MGGYSWHVTQLLPFLERLTRSYRYDHRMSFISVLFALLLEQVRPFQRGNLFHAGMRRWVRWCTHSLDAGEPHHGWLAWSAAVVVPAFLALLIYNILDVSVGWPLALAWNTLVLYAALGFRQLSFHFTQIRDALVSGDDALARHLLANWQEHEVKDMPRSEVVGQVIEASVLAAHRHVFGVLTWFSVLAAFGLGPAGAVVYRLSEFVVRCWGHQSEMLQQPVSVALQTSSRLAWHRIDWIPARVTAISFAVIGNFEEAVDSWRRYAQRSQTFNDGVVLAATAGAVNIRLPALDVVPQPLQAPLEADAQSERPAPDLPHLAVVVGLVWRTVILWVVLLALLALAHLPG